MAHEAIVRSVEWQPRQVSAMLVVGGREMPIWISANEDLFQETDFLLPISLLPAMKAGTPLVLPGEVSPRLLSSAPQIQDILNMWESIYKHVPVKARKREGSLERGKGVACLFGGGIDSFHTMLRHRGEITHLIHLDRSGGDEAAREVNFQRLRKVARETDTTLIEVDANIHEFARQDRLTWRVGPWIVALSLLFQHLFGKILVAGSTTSNYDNLRPQGTHPILDPLWGTESTDFHHDGCEVRRVEKAAQIAGYDIAMKYLLVCGKEGGAYNCGRCEKCIRSMIGLSAAGALGRCETLPDEVDLDAVASLDLSEYSESYFARENLRALERSGADPELAAALGEAIRRGAHVIAHSGYKEENLEDLRGKLETSKQEARQQRERIQRLQKQSARNKRLSAENARLNARLSSRRHRFVDAAANVILRIPGVEKLLRGSKSGSRR